MSESTPMRARLSREKKKLSNGEKKRRRLASIWAWDPHCRACGVVTRLVPHTPHHRDPDDKAVLPRWLDREDPRYEKLHDFKKRRLTCFACANDRAAEREGERDLGELHYRSGRFPAPYILGPNANATHATPLAVGADLMLQAERLAHRSLTVSPTESDGLQRAEK